MQKSEAGAITNTLIYAYDIDGNRVNLQENGSETRFIVDNNQAYAQVVQEQDGSGQTQVSYLYGDDLLQQQRGTEVSHYHYDGLGSTRLLTDATGALTDRYRYEAFGEAIEELGNTTNRYRFTGEQHDSNLGFYYLRARYYNPHQGRFTQQDSWMGNSSDPITLHKYLYANANPVNNIDPTGNFSLGSVSASINTVGTLSSIVSFSSDVFNAGGDVTATQAGMFALASVGGMKLFKIMGKKFLRKYNCGSPNEKKICKIFHSDGKRIASLRATLGIGKNKNIAFADYITSDGVGTMVAASGRHTHPGTVGIPSPTRYITFTVGHSRDLDSEVKLYENLAIRFSSSTKGLTRIVSELPICASCAGVGPQFRSDFKNVLLMTRGGVTGRSKK